MPSSTLFLKDIGIVIAIILVDLALSGDNALVIGAVASKLHGQQRKNAITLGGAIAIVLRIALTLLAVLLLQIPFVNIIGGILVFIIAVQLIRDIDTEKKEEQEIVQAETQDPQPKKRRNLRRPLSSNSSLLRAITTIAIADLSMSLDNALAIAALARQNYLLLAVGLFLSVIFLLVASAVIANLIARFPILMYLSGLILAITAGTMVLGDPRVDPVIARWDPAVPGPLNIELLGGVGILFIVIALLIRPHNPTPKQVAGH